MADVEKPWVTADNVRVGPGDVVWSWDGHRTYEVALTDDGFTERGHECDWCEFDSRPPEIVADWHSTAVAAIEHALGVYRKRMNEASDGIRRATNALAQLDA